MRSIITLAKKEWADYFISPVGYVFTSLLLVLANWLFFSDLFILGQADLGPFFSTLVFLLSVFVPAISMNLLAEEKKNSTWEVLLSLPVDEKEFVLGKFIGSGLYLLYTLGLSLSTVLIVYLLGRPDMGIVAGEMGGLILLSLAFLAVGIFMSSLSSQPIVGFLGSSVILIINNLMGQEIFVSRLPTTFGRLAQGVSLSYRFSNFSNGLVQVSDLVFFASFVMVFLILTVMSLKARNK